MPLYEPDRIEYEITSGRVQIVAGSAQLPAYWARPRLGSKFSGVVLIHDWWGLNDLIRRLANLLAQMGHYVIAPDLFAGQTTDDPQRALRLVDELADSAYPVIDSTLTVLENHNHSNRQVAAVGIGMGGSLAFEAAVTRTDLEAAVAFSGFPQRYFGRFQAASTPICAFFGEDEPYIGQPIINKLRAELHKSALPHEVHVMQALGHTLIADDLPPVQTQQSREVIKRTLFFLDKHLSEK